MISPEEFGPPNYRGGDATAPRRDGAGNPIDENGSHICGRKVRNRQGGWCGKGPGSGVPGSPCRAHGGGAPQVKRANQRKLVEGDLRKILVRKYGRNEPVTDPLTELQLHAGRVKAWSEFLEDKLTVLRSSSQWNTEQVNGIAQLLESSMKEVRQTLKDIAQLNIDERLIAIEQGKVDMLFRAISAALEAAGITNPAHVQRAMGAAAAQLRVMKSEKEPVTGRKVLA